MIARWNYCTLYRVSDILSDSTYIPIGTYILFGSENRETTGGNYTITCLNIGYNKCIRVLENGAEILYYYDDSIQSVSEKINYQMMWVITGQHLVILHQES